MILSPPLAGIVRPLAPHLPRIAALLTLALTVAAVRAESWVDVPPSPPKPESLQWDRDSLTPLDADRLAAVWRAARRRDGNYSIERGRIDCRGVSLQVATSSYVDTGAGRAGYGGALTDYAAGTRTWQGRSTRLTDAELADGFRFPLPGSAEARMIEAVCGTRSGLRPGQGGVRGESDAATLDLRLEQAKQACALSNVQAARLRAGWLASTSGCTPASAPGCNSATQDEVAMSTAIAGLSNDLARAASGSTCSYLPEALAQAAETDAQAAAAARFQACVAQAIAQLDDRLSDADVIATGVFGACRGALPAAVAQGALFANGLLPGLTAAVLKNRSSGRVSLPARPKRSQAE